MATFAEVADAKNQLIRKALGGALLVADYATAALDDIVVAGPPVSLSIPVGYESLGKLTEDGMAVSDEVEISELRGWGDAYPSRLDVNSENLSITVTAMETRAAVLDAFYNVDQSAIVPDVTTGTVKFDKPEVPQLRDKRVLALGRDINKSNGLDVYVGVHFPKANLSQNGEQTLANNDSALAYPVQIRALFDSTEGTACRIFFAGPGLAGLVTDMGYGA